MPHWREIGGPPVDPCRVEDFGSLLGEATVKAQLKGEISRDWLPEGL